MHITSHEKFATYFNKKYSGAYCLITAQDIKDMITCGLIKRYGFYLRDDLETAKGILKYEQLLGQRSGQKPNEDNQESPKCKMCGQPLPIEPKNKTGRPKEYCSKCESFRSKERQKKLRQGRKKQAEALSAK